MSVRDDLDVMARTIWGESRSESFQGMLAVAWVIVNRARLQIRGTSPRDVCLAPWQFSCWNSADPNLKRLSALTVDADPSLVMCLAAAATALGRAQADPTMGSTDYHTVSRPPGVDTWPPKWAADYVPTVRIGAHQFYRRS